MNKKNLTTGIVIVAIIVIVTISASYYQQLSSTQDTKPTTTSSQSNEEMASEKTSDTYKDGVYEVDGNYISPGGAEEIGVALTLEDGIIVDSSVEVKATRDISVAMQTDFASHYKEQVIGKNIDDVMLTKVSGSSLTPKGFNDAVGKIKEQAKS